MEYHDPYKKNGTITTRVVCAVCFILFTFLWLYDFQADVLTVAQHALSHGMTHYDRTVGAVLITLVLLLLQGAVSVLSRLPIVLHGLTYVPSMLLLAYISDIDADIDSHYTFGAWTWAAPLLFVVWLALMWGAHQLKPLLADGKRRPSGLFSRVVWVNLLQMTVLMLVVAGVGNTDAVFHYRAHAETALMRQDYDEALLAGSESLETDAHLTMLRAYALSCKGEMGDHLFDYAIAGSGSDLLPMPGGASHLMVLPADTLWKHLGARPAHPMTADTYFRLLAKDSLATDAVRDYQLCGYLVDRNLQDFIRVLPRYYQAGDSLASQSMPRHYREALVLCRQQHPEWGVAFRDSLMEMKWQEMKDFEKDLEQQAKSSESHHLKMYSQYGKTYWYYYTYGK